MVSLKNSKYLSVVMFFLLLGGCGSHPDRREEVKAPVDIYDQLKNDNVQYIGEEKGVVRGSPEYVLKTLTDVRAHYFEKKYDIARKLCKRIISLVPSTAEAYYWLARMAIDEGDFQQAYNMSSKGLTYATAPNMKAELQRMQLMTQMGAN